MSNLEPDPTQGYSSQDDQLMQELATATGQWSQGFATPTQQQIWSQVTGTGVAAELSAEATNIGLLNQMNPGRYTPTTQTAISAAAQQDPRWASADALGRQILGELYNLKLMGFQGDIGTNVPLSPITSGPSGDTGIGSSPTGGMTSPQADAWSQLSQTLQQYGFTGTDLTNLVAFAKGEILSGNSQTQILLDLQQTPEFQARFPAIGVLSQKGVAITPAQYISLEQSYAQLEQAGGIPPNYASYDQLIANQVSPSEYADRINKGFLAVSTAPPEVVQSMQDYYGVTKGQLAAYFLDPTKGEPLLLQQAQAAQIGGASAVSGFGRVTSDQAMRLAQQGVSYGQAQQGFQHLASESQLFQPLPGQGSRFTPTTEQLLGAQFGSDGQTALQLQIQAEQEKNYFNQGTSVASTSQGLTGAGAVQR